MWPNYVCLWLHEGVSAVQPSEFSIGRDQIIVILCSLAYPLEGLHTSHALVVDPIGQFVVFTFVELILHYNVCRMKEPFLNPIGIVANLQHFVEHFQELQEVLVIQVIDDVSHVH